MNDEWRAWTFEVRFHEPQPLAERTAWCADEAVMDRLRQLEAAEPPLPPGDPPSPLAQFLAGPASLEPRGTPRYCTRIEQWVREQVGLLKRFDATLRLHQDRAYLRRIADYALSAARSRTLRWRAHLRHAAAQEPDCVRRTFDRVIRPEFPAVLWDDFMREVGGFVDAANALPAPAPAPAAPSSSGAMARPKIRGMAAMLPVSLLST